MKALLFYGAIALIHVLLGAVTIACVIYLVKLFLKHMK